MDTVERKRSGWVWAITIFYLVGTAFTLFGFYVVLGTHAPVEPAQRAYFDSLTPVDYAMTGGIILCNLGGAITLFLLRRVAPLLFSTGFAITLLQYVWQIAAKNYLGAISGAGLVGTVFGLALSLAVILYAFRLRNRGVLA